MKIYFDTEFTGLHQQTTLMSIGLISENGKAFYAELTDYDTKQIDEWLHENVIKNFGKPAGFVSDSTIKFDLEYHVCTKEELKQLLTMWLSQFDHINIWSDCLAYDWVLFCDIFGHAFNIPQNIFYIPMDLSTLLLTKGINPDESREKLAGINFSEKSSRKHNALHDALMIKKIVESLL